MLMTAIPAKVVLETVNKKKVRNVNLKKKHVRVQLKDLASKLNVFIILQISSFYLFVYLFQGA